MALGDIVFSFPFTDPSGLAFDGKNLWVGRYSNNTVYCLAVDGSVLFTFGTTGPPRGLTFDGKNLLVHDFTANLIELYDMLGNRIETVTPPILSVEALTFDGKNIWCGCNIRLIYCIDYNGNEIRRYPTVNRPRGLTFDGKNLWFCDSTAASRIYCMNLENGAILNSFAAPVAAGGSYSLAFDGKYLWLGEIITDVIYQISLT